MAEAVLLAFDTSIAVGSVAVGSAGHLLASATLEDRREHASHLVPAIDKALERAGIGVEALDGIVVGEGPGSFTGVRVAAATAKGLAHARRVPLWAFSSLAAAALAEDAGRMRYVLFDARHDRVYGACYEVDGSTLAEQVAPHPGTVLDALRGPVPTGATFIGDGARRHREAIEAAGFHVGPGPSRTLAEGLLRLHGALGARTPVVDVASWEPRYVRPPSVERSWSR
ncbi:MAG: tRNA (adenosine(37)-N6)-threonylcarbamoyltransferase complex dimerization subunit type 1 TsaB [Gemmatimonadales bacterium]